MLMNTFPLEELVFMQKPGGSRFVLRCVPLHTSGFPFIPSSVSVDLSPLCPLLLISPLLSESAPRPTRGICNSLSLFII